jgi:hypothetical protein
MSQPLPEPTSAELSLARKMAREGATVEAIHAAVGWRRNVRSTRERLIRYGIRIMSRQLAHRGADTKLSKRAAVDFRDYRPGAGRAGP